MRKHGTVVRWEAQRGFGFIRSADTAGDIFFHKQDFRSALPPREGLAVSFEEIHVGGKGPRAMAVQSTSDQAGHPAGGRDAPPAARRGSARALPSQAIRHQGHSRHRVPPAAGASVGSSGFALVLMAAWVMALIWGVSVNRMPAMTLLLALLLNLVTFFMYWVDKYAARQRRWRTAEKTLHLLALLGGWPAAWIAQQLLRHKSSKASFLAAYWVTVALNGLALAVWLLRRPLSAALQNT